MTPFLQGQLVGSRQVTWTSACMDGAPAAPGMPIACKDRTLLEVFSSSSLEKTKQQQQQNTQNPSKNNNNNNKNQPF